MIEESKPRGEVCIGMVKRERPEADLWGKGKCQVDDWGGWLARECRGGMTRASAGDG